MRPIGLQANDAPQRDISPSPVSPAHLEQRLSTGEGVGVRREGSTSERPANTKAGTGRHTVSIKPVGSSTEPNSKRVEFAEDLDETIEIRAKGRQRPVKRAEVCTPQNSADTLAVAAGTRSPVNEESP